MTLSLTGTSAVSTAYMLGAFGVIDKTAPVLLNLFFPMEQVFDTEEIYWDKIQRARSLAPLVRSTVAGEPQPSRGLETHGLNPPYLKPKHIVEPIRALKRRAGEKLLGSMTLSERMELTMLDNLYIEDDSITRMEERIAAVLLQTGTMTLSGAKHPPVTIDLGRNALNTMILTGAARWGQSGVDPLQNMQDWAAGVQGRSGFHPGTVVMDPKAARLFTKSPSVLTVMQSFRQTQGNVDLAGKVTGGAPGQEVKYLGSLGEFDVYQYQQLYTDAFDDTATVKQIMPDYTVIMGNPVGCGGVRTYGAILDAESLIPIARFPKMWLERDPSAWQTMVQSAPMPVIGWPDASFCATVGP